MRNQDVLLSLLASLAVTGCKQIECGDGTIERDGTCAPGNGMISPARCGENTVLVGDRCEPLFPPTECDPATTEMVFDETSGVTTCTGVGGGGCDLVCSTPSSTTKQTICGQLYDFETNEKLSVANATGAVCDPAAPTADGPCAVTIVPYDAINFAGDPQGTAPVPHGDITINDCGQYRIRDVDTNMVQLYVGLGIDDANMPLGPSGYVVTSAIAFAKEPGKATDDVEHWIVKPATTTAWANSGGPSLTTTGVYAGVFRAHKAGVGDQLANQPGVTITGPGSPNDFYFDAAETTRTMIDTGATSTGANGTALVSNTGVLSSGWAGSGGITDTANCTWEQHTAATLQNIVFIQLYRKRDAVGKTCNE